MQHPTHLPLAFFAFFLPLLLAACQADEASEGAPGEPCLTDLDCDGLRCMAFVCVEPNPTHDPTRITDAGPSDEPDATPDAEPPSSCTPSCLDATTRLACFDNRTYPIPCLPEERCLAAICIPEEDRCVEGTRRCAQGYLVQRCSGEGWVQEESCGTAGCIPSEARCADDSLLPNLQARSIDGSAGTFRVGDSYFFTFSFARRGTFSADSATTCDVLLSLDDAPSANDVLLRSYEIFSEIIVDTEVSHNDGAYIPEDIQHGSYRLLGVCDREGLLEESNEGDNFVDAGPLVVVVPSIPPIECPLDPFDPNESVNIAAALPWPGSWEGLSVCTGNVDLYSICLEQEESIVISIAFVDELGDIDIEFTTTDDISYSSRGTNDEERLELNLTPGCHTLRVYIYPDSIEPKINTYTLSVGLTP